MGACEPANYQPYTQSALGAPTHDHELASCNVFGQHTNHPPPGEPLGAAPSSTCLPVLVSWCLVSGSARPSAAVAAACADTELDARRPPAASPTTPQRPRKQAHEAWQQGTGCQSEDVVLVVCLEERSIIAILEDSRKAAEHQTHSLERRPTTHFRSLRCLPRRQAGSIQAFSIPHTLQARGKIPSTCQSRTPPQ